MYTSCIRHIHVPVWFGFEICSTWVDNIVCNVVVELLFISRFRLRPLMGTRQERPGI